MDDACAVTAASDRQSAVAPFSFDFGSEFIRENLPAEKRTALAVVTQNRRLDLAQDVAVRTVRLQASSIDMDQTLNKAHRLSRVMGVIVLIAVLLIK